MWPISHGGFLVWQPLLLAHLRQDVDVGGGPRVLGNIENRKILTRLWKSSSMSQKGTSETTLTAPDMIILAKVSGIKVSEGRVIKPTTWPSLKKVSSWRRRHSFKLQLINPPASAGGN